MRGQDASSGHQDVRPRSFRTSPHALDPSHGASPAPRASSPAPSRALGLSLPPSFPLDLTQRILRVLKDAGSPMKAAQLQKKCDVPKKRLNQVLYQMKTKQLVVNLGQATWRLSGDATGEVVPTEPARPSQGNFPSWGAGEGALGRTQHEQARQWASPDLGLGSNSISTPWGLVMSPHHALVSFSGQWR